MRQLQGKRALVTGAASGIGQALALELAGQQVELLLADIDQVGLASTAAEVASLGATAHTAHCDLTCAGDLDCLVDQAVDSWAGVDLLINNAGVTYHGLTHEMPEQEWDRVLAINLHGQVNLTRRLLPWLLARPQAHVLNVCSILGLVGLPRVSAYCTAKFAMVGFSEALRAEYGRQGLGVTALCPGFVRTNLFAAAHTPRPGDAPKQPPGFMCTTPQCVARRAVRAVRGNHKRVVMEPFARLAWAAKCLAPTPLDWALRLGEWKRVRAKAAKLRAYSDDPTTALRLAVQGPEVPLQKVA